MKKIISLVLCVCMILAMGVQSAALDKVVMSVSYKNSSGNVTSNFDSFKEGWVYAIELSMEDGISDVSVSLKEDWVAEDGEFDGSFFNDTGFGWDTIEFPEGCNITVNLNGNTIDRGLTEWEYNGEVMCVHKDTNVTIKDGTIKGGFSCNGGSGIHVKGGNLYLENVNIVDNRSEDDDGVGIAVHGGNVTMVGGCIENNKGVVGSIGTWGGAIAVFDGNVHLKNVSIKNNSVEGDSFGALGGAIYISGGRLEAEYCEILSNNADTAGGAIRQDGGSLTLVHCDISRNISGAYGGAADIHGGMLTMENCNIYDNLAKKGADGFRHQGGNVLITGCYYQGSCIEEGAHTPNAKPGTLFPPIVWENMSDTKIEHSSAAGSIVSSGNIVLIAGAVVVIAVVAVVAVRRKKTAAPEEEAASEE